MSPNKSVFIVTISILFCIGAGVLIGYFCSKQSTPADNGKEESLQNGYYAGAAKVDITGPIVEVNMMGYAHPEQVANGLHTRLFSRAYVVTDSLKASRVAFVTFDGGMTSQLLKIKVIEKLKANLSSDIFTEKNVVISGTHTHSGPAGFFQFLLFEVTSLGHVIDTTESFVNGIAESIIIANMNLQKANIFYGKDKLKEAANINRSPTSYLQNPESERKKYDSNTDEEMDVLKFQTETGEPIAMLSWYPSHPTSMNFTNRLISSDHKGRASTLFEKYMSDKKEDYVAAFAQANVGDVSPRTKGAICVENTTTPGMPCDNFTSTCDNRSQGCIAFGPGVDMFDSTNIIGQRQYNAAKTIFENTMIKLNGTVSYVQQYIDMNKQQVMLEDGRTVQSCRAGMGYSFAAGTTDGAGAFDFYQGMTEEIPFWKNIRDALVSILCTETPPPEYYECHRPKPVLLPTGYMDVPRKWHPSISEIQMLRIGELIIAAVPGEFTTMSGRRLKEMIRTNLEGQMDTAKVVIAGLSNVYTHYITTEEEYKAQRYEAGSTIYGPNTLNIYLEKFKNLLQPLITSEPYDSGVKPVINEPDQSRLSYVPGRDETPQDKNFGDVLIDADDIYYQGDTVEVKLQAANPRQNLKLGSTYLKVLQVNEDQEEIIYTDEDWETMFKWEGSQEDQRGNLFTALSDVIAETTGTRLDLELAIRLSEEDTSEGKYLNEYHGSDENFLEKLYQLEIIRNTKEGAANYRISKGSSTATITWRIPENENEGNYQIIYEGDYKTRSEVVPFQGRSKMFRVKKK